MASRKSKNLGPRRLAELRKRKLKGSREVETRGIDLANSLFTKIPKTVRQSLATRLEDEVKYISNRDIMAAAVASYLPRAVELLLDVGLAKSTKATQRPRAFDDTTWQCLEAAENIVDASKVALLRAVLSLLSKEGLRSVDLYQCLNELQRQERAGSSKGK